MVVSYRMVSYPRKARLLCSEMGIFKLRLVKLMYLDVQSGDVKQQTTFEHNETGVGSLTLNDDPIVFRDMFPK